MSCSPDEEGVTLTLDRFDPGRAQSGKRVPSLLLPGDVVVPVEFVLHGDSEPNPAFRQSDLSITFKVREGNWLCEVQVLVTCLFTQLSVFQ